MVEREGKKPIKKQLEQMYMLFPSIMGRNVRAIGGGYQDLDKFYDGTDKDPNELWTEDGFLVEAARWNQLSSKLAIPYPLFFARGSFHPNISGETTNQWLGFEFGGGQFSGILCFVKLDDKLYLEAGGSSGSNLLLDIENLAPSDYTTAKHIYSIKISRQSCEFFIDGEMVGFFVWSPHLREYRNTSDPLIKADNREPYAYGVLKGNIPRHHSTLIEGHSEETDFRMDFTPPSFRYCPGLRKPFRHYPLYQEGTTSLMGGQTLSSGDMVSDVFPLMGWKNKQLLFRSETNDSTVNLEVFDTQGELAGGKFLLDSCR